MASLPALPAGRQAVGSRNEMERGNRKDAELNGIVLFSKPPCQQKHIKNNQKK
jgi:hypothetical protein